MLRLQRDIFRQRFYGNAKDAAEIFKLSIDVFPNNDNPYDGYAEALMTLGKNEEAILNYKKSLELNPNNNNNAKQMLEKLEKETNKYSFINIYIIQMTNKIRTPYSSFYIKTNSILIF